MKKLLSYVLFIVSLLSFSCVYGYTFDEFVDFCNENYNLCSSNCKNQIDWLNSNKSTILTTFNSTDNIDDYDGFFLMGQNGYRLYLVAFKNITRWYATNNQLSFYGGQYTDLTKYNGNSMYKSNIYTISSSGYNISNQQASVGIMAIDAEDGKYGNMISNNYYTTGLEFEPNYFQKVRFIGINDEFNALKYDYSINSWNLGTFESIPEDVDKIVIKLFFHDGSIAFTDSFLTFTKQFNQGNFFINDNVLYIYSRLIKYNTKYNLLMYTYDDRGNFIESYQYNYVFYPTNATIENGVVISPGSGDYNVQNSTNDSISNLNDTTAAYDTMSRLNESGELVHQLNYKVYPNHSYDILFAMTQNIVNTLYQSGDVYFDLDFEHNGYVHRLYSSQFITPINRITSWIILAVNFGFVYLLYKQGAELIHTIQEGDLYVLELEDANEYFYM